MAQLINLNGQVLPADTPIFQADNRAFRYGDGLFESIRVSDGEMPFFERHWRRLSLGMQCLKIELPVHFAPAFFKNEISKLTDNQGNWRVRLSIFRGGGGLYAPISHAPVFLIEISPLDYSQFQLNEQGLRLGIFDEIRIQTLFASQQFGLQNFKTNNALPLVLASIFKNESGLDDCFLLNHEGRIVCASSANVFLVKHSVLSTPPLSEGCVAGTMRSAVMDLAQKQGFVVNEQPINLVELESADEFFLTNAIQGIRWVGKFNGKMFKNEHAVLMHRMLVEEYSQKR